MTHVILLLAVVGIPGVSGLLGTRGTTDSAVSNAFAAGTANPSVAPTRGFILKPPSVPVPSLADRRQALIYSVQGGDVLGTIAEKYGLRMDTLRQSNSISDVDALQIGEGILIPPTNGVMVRVAAGDTVAVLAERYHVEQSVIIDYNLVRDPVNLTPGALLMIPDGTGLITAQEQTVVSAAKPTSSAPAGPQSISYGRSSYNHFPWGQCTYWVASRRNIPWNGNAWQWYGGAQAYGMATGRTPRVGAIMVTWESRYYGHVALVEAVYGDGSWLVSEMNYRGLGIVDQRRISYGQVPLIGFIY